MDKFVGIITYLLFLKNVSAVPPSPTDRLWEELISAKSVMTNIATQLEKFNSLYLMKLEQRMNSMASTLSSIDSNVKNLQERAHVWDTFQLHVSAWNEQMNTLDKKVEIINKGQEKIFNLDNKMNSISNIEYKTERIIGKLDDNLSNLQTIIKIVENQNHDPLLGEFTTRGVLSTLKTIERKLDKLQMSHSSSQSMLAKQISDSKRQSDDQEGQGQQKGKLLIKCNTPPIVEELLSDVASKVDVMFDKFTGNDEQSDESSGDDNQENSNDNSQESKNDPDLKLMKGLLKRLNQPCKRTIKVLENLEVSIKSIDNTTLTILEDGQSVHSDLLNLCRNNDKKVSTKTVDLVSKIDQVLVQIDQKFSTGQESISSYFTEQREHFSTILRSELDKSCRIQIPVTTPKIDSTDDIYFEGPRKYSNKFNCEELDSSEPNGVYSLGESEFKNNAGRSYNIRYCEQINNEFWTVIQRRGINPDQQKFNLTWAMYKDGFGSLNQDFWFGNDFIYNLSEEKQLVLRVELEDFEGNTAWAEYNTFVVDSEENNYRLRIGGYRGNASDSFSSHNNSSFSTYDRTNDQAPVCCPCAASYGGGWWFNSCFEANLNGVYYKRPSNNNYYRGLIWELWLGNYSLKKTKMLVRPRLITDEELTIVPQTEISVTTESDIPEDP